MSRGVRTLVAAGVALWILTPTGADAQDLVAGWEGQQGRGYTFVAPGFERPTAGANRLAIRVSASYLYYEFGEDTTEVTSPGAAVSVGYRIVRNRVVASFSPGAEFRRTTRTNAAGAGTVNEFGPTFQADVFARLADRLRGSVIASYGHANRYVWSRAGLVYELAPGAGAGIELTAQGNVDSRVSQAGAVLDFFLPGPAVSLQVRGGVAASDGDRQPYFGIGMYRRF